MRDRYLSPSAAYPEQLDLSDRPAQKGSFRAQYLTLTLGSPDRGGDSGNVVLWPGLDKCTGRRTLTVH